MSKSIFSSEIGSKLAPNLPEPAPKPEAPPAHDSWTGHSWELAHTSAASADVVALDAKDELVVVSPEPYKGAVKDNGFDVAGNRVLVAVVPPGSLAKEEVKKGAAGRVLMPDGKTFVCGGELLRLALSRGGKLLTE